MTDQKHTKEPERGEKPTLVIVLFKEYAIVNSDKIYIGDTVVKPARIAACVNAMQGIDDPEAFMRDVRDYAALNAGDSHSKWVTARNKVRKHLKGGAE